MFQKADASGNWLRLGYLAGDLVLLDQTHVSGGGQGRRHGGGSHAHLRGAGMRDSVG